MVVLIGCEIVQSDAQQSRELTEILLRHYHLLVAGEYLRSVLRQRIDATKLRQCYLISLSTQLLHSRIQMAVGTAEAHDEQFRVVLVALHLKVGHRNELHLVVAQPVHAVVVLRLRAYRARLAVFLQSAEDVRIALLSRHRPIAHVRLRVAMIGRILVFLFLRRIVWMYLRQLVHSRELPCRRAVCDKSVCQQHHRSEMFERNLARHISRVEAVCRACGRYHRHRAFTVTSVEHLQQVGLLALCGQTRRRTTSLNVDNDQRKLVNHCQIYRL